MASITAMLLTLVVAAVVVGRSVDGRPIDAVHRPGSGPRVLVVGCIHGNECAGTAVVAALRHVPMLDDLWLVPTFNPDGEARDTRQNAHGVDLNRNFGAGWRRSGRPWSTYYSGRRPFSEPETRAARALILRIHPTLTIWFHQHLDEVWVYGRSVAAGRRYAAASGLRLAVRRWEPGSATNWQNHLAGGGASITVELPAGRLSPAEALRQARAVLVAAR
jgi:protein MpaA